MALTNAEKQQRWRERQAAHQYRLAVAENIIRLFEEANGHPARTMRELEKWVISRKGRAVLAAHRGSDGKINPVAKVKS